MDKVFPFFREFLILSFISLIIFLLEFFNLLKFPKILFSAVTNPLTFGLYQTGQNFGRQFFFLAESRFAAQKTKALQEQVAALLSENATLRSKLAEDDALVEQNKALDPKTYNLISARPIGVDRYLKIDKGSSDGIKVNQTVVFKDSFIGQIVQVSDKNASVRLSTDPDSKISVFSLNKDGKAKGIITGQFGSEMLMDKILHDEKISNGDLVYTEGVETSIARGLIVGQVSNVDERQNQVFKQAKVKPLFDLGDLELVFVINE